MKNIRLLLQVAGLSVLMAGCMSAAPEAEEGIYFLQQRETDAPQMLALLEGELTLTEGCLRIQSNYGDESYAAIWPFEFSFDSSGDSIDILNGERQVVAQVGNQIRVSGGEVPSLSKEEFEASFTGTFGCSGRYWIVNSDVEVITP